MTSDVFWAVLGISVSVIFGVLGIYLTLRSRYPGKITFVNEQTIELFDSVGNTIEKLEVTYDNSEVNQNLVLLNGSFINSGKSDITVDMVEKPIHLSLPAGYKWLSGSMVQSDVDAELTLVDDRTIAISTGLFRKNEFVRFHALAQLPDSEDEKSNSKKLKDSLTFSHRITNTANIDECEVDQTKANKKYFRRRILPILAFVLIAVGSVGFQVSKGFPHKMTYLFDVNGVTEQVQIKVIDNKTVDVHSLVSDFESEMLFSDFVARTLDTPKLEKASNGWLALVLLGAQVLMFLVMLSMPTYEYYRNKRLLKTLGLC
ncbi:hypothetical protein [Vibrio parahaemolyticus]|uniref:hypothetical protein n=1 Tax=Vibrio parahaemolyticus TaxID=670 RepID=UPI0004182B4C|nr:hypothetical protein [Vibrio parahaemolyticus]